MHHRAIPAGLAGYASRDPGKRLTSSQGNFLAALRALSRALALRKAGPSALNGVCNRVLDLI